MTVKLSDLRYDSWASIARALRDGLRPELADLLAALGRGEPYVPAIAQEYLAELLDAKDRRGRPRLSTRAATRQLISGMLLDADVRRHKREGCTLKEAFERVAMERHRSISSIRNRYYEYNASTEKIARLKK